MEDFKLKLTGKGLKVTPQRMLILEAIHVLHNHPIAEQILEYVRQRHPNIATGTIYNVLETLVQNHLVKKVKTEKDVMRYDHVVENHHHLYCSECDTIEDYENEELDRLLEAFFEQHHIDNFVIDDVRLHINGKFIVHKNR